MADEKSENKESRKVLFEREYVVPLRKEWHKVQDYKRAAKAVKALKEFMVQHMKIYDRDTRKVKVDIHLNNEIRFRGMLSPLHKVKVKAVKYDDGTVAVRLAELPKHIAFEVARKARQEAEILKNTADKPKSEIKVEEKKDESKKEETKEKEETSKLAEEKMDKNMANEAKHTSGVKKAPEIKRKALKR